jgi:hypothetical protein
LSEPTTINLPVPVEGRCLNCDAALLGEYCAQCGQHVKHHVHSTRAVAAELFEDLTHADHRVWHTLKPLLRRPGEVTVEYLRGKRASYTPPFRLYIVLSLLFFLTASLSHDTVEVVTLNDDGQAYALSAETQAQLDEFLQRIDPDRRPKARSQLEGALVKVPPDQQAKMVAGLFNACSPETLSAVLPESLAGKERLIDACRAITTGKGDDVVEEMGKHVPQMMFFLIPLIALCAKVLYLGSRRYYAEHVLFFVHFHAAFFLLGTLNNVAGWLLGFFKGSWAGFLAGLLTAAFVIYVPIYLYRAMRRVYAQGRWVTRLKFFFLLGAYVWSVFLTFAGLAAITAMTLK